LFKEVGSAQKNATRRVLVKYSKNDVGGMSSITNLSANAASTRHKFRSKRKATRRDGTEAGTILDHHPSKWGNMSRCEVGSGDSVHDVIIAWALHPKSYLRAQIEECFDRAMGLFHRL
jgi:hypothetical protein